MDKEEVRREILQLSRQDQIEDYLDQRVPFIMQVAEGKVVFG